MDLGQEMKVEASTIQAAWSTKKTRQSKTIRNFIVTAFIVFILVFLYITSSNTLLESFSTLLPSLFRNGDNLDNPAGPEGYQYLLGVGKADITGYEMPLS